MGQTILVTGATGLLGRALCQRLLQDGYKLHVFGRRTEPEFRRRFFLPCDYSAWPDPSNTPAPQVKADHVVHLMGESIGNRRWTPEIKKQLVDSRVKTTGNLIRSFPNDVKTFVSASAIGIYGDRQDKWLDENAVTRHLDVASSDFLAQLCNQWEAAARRAPCRNVQLRIGLVLSLRGGMLDRLGPIFENGFGGRLASGRQWMSWIHLEDLVEIFVHAIKNETLHGPLNAVAPAPCTNRAFTHALSNATKTYALFPVPKVALRFAVGEFASALLASQRVASKRLIASGFTFRYSSIDQALNHLYGWKRSRFDRIYLDTLWVNRTRARVFDFFSSETNLERITPSLLRFKVIYKSTPTIKKGTLIDYALKIHGVPARWRTLISIWEPGVRFEDQQLRGPYAKWHHTHSFSDLAGGTLIDDQVVYRLPLAALGGQLAHPWIRNDIRSIFDFRSQTILDLVRRSEI